MCMLLLFSLMPLLIEHFLAIFINVFYNVFFFNYKPLSDSNNVRDEALGSLTSLGLPKDLQFIKYIVKHIAVFN